MMLVWEEDMVKALRKERESLREENARLAALVQQYHPAYLGLPHVVRERDEARAEVARLNGIWEKAEHRCPQCGTPNERLRRAEAKLARCVEAGNHLRGFAAGTDLGKAYIADWDAALAAAKGE